MPVELRTVTEADAPFLYKLLQDRPPEANISHKVMPSYEQHLAFVKSRPYAVWYIVTDGKEDIGAVYLTKADELGGFVMTEKARSGYGIYALKKLMAMHPRRRYLSNVSPRNEYAGKLMVALGFRHIQNTWELEAR